MATGTAAAQAARNRLQALNEGPADLADQAARRALTAAGQRVTPTTKDSGLGTIANYRLGNINSIAQQQGYRPPTQPAAPRQTSTGSGSSGARRSGGGGGGGGAPQFSQAMLDWAAGLLGGGRPQAQTASTLDLPDYQGTAMRAFDPSMWNQGREALNQGVAQDTATAQGATQNMLGFLNNNYRNAFSGGPQTTMANAPGMNGQAMGRMLQGQGVNAYENQGYQQQLGEGRQADAGLSSLFAALAGNEDVMQRSRLANAQQYGTQATDAITAAGRAGNLGLNLGQGQAQSAWQQRADEWAREDSQMQQQVLQQEAMNNWQRQNQVQDLNTTNTNSYTNSTLQALFGLLPSIQGNPNLALPCKVWGSADGRQGQEDQHRGSRLRDQGVAERLGCPRSAGPAGVDGPGLRPEREPPRRGALRLRSDVALRDGPDVRPAGAVRWRRQHPTAVGEGGAGALRPESGGAARQPDAGQRDVDG
jgi:hypothetical protein